MEEQNHSLENLEYFQKNCLVQIDNLENQRFGNLDRIKQIETRLYGLGEVKKLLIKLKNSKMFDKKDFILNTINTALGDIFVDQEIRIDLKASNTNQEASKLNIKYDIVFYQNNVEMASNEKLLIKIGGGVMAFISILFKILVGYIYSKNKFYIFDESLSEVSELYMPRMGRFLQKFCEKHGFTIILITHTPIIAEYADLVYRLDGEFQDGVPTLKIDKIEGTYPEENYIYTKIENFQSIKKLEFRYKGFTAIIGKNSIGKSASFRAVNSILFNNFDMKEFPRFLSADKPDKLLNSKIEFGKFHTKDDPKNEETKISLYKKGQSIIWNFNNMEFVGKNLAFEKVKEKIESIGFRYLNLKEQYKNFKGNLKEQTERLAVTTQQDGYYLIGGKATDTAKVFDFLFDTREVTLALLDLNNDILSLEQELNSLNLENGNIANIVSRSRIELKRWEVLYKITLLGEIKRSKELIKFYIEEVEHLSEEKHHIEKVLNLSDTIWRLENTKANINATQLNIVTRQRILEIIDKLVSNSMNISLINNINSLSNSINYQSKIKNIQTLNSKIVELRFIIYLSSSYEAIKVNFSNYRLMGIVLGKLLNNMASIKILEDFTMIYDNINLIKNKITLSTVKFNTLVKLISNLNMRVNIEGIVNDLTYLNTQKHKVAQAIDYNKKCFAIYDKYIIKTDLENTIYNIVDLDKKLAAKRSQKIYMHTKIDTLPEEFGLVPCPSCATLGFTCIGH